MKIGIVGVGYVGLVTGACLSDFGHSVVCLDNDAEKIKHLNDGKSPIYEPGLENIVQKNANSGRLSFDTSLDKFLRFAEVIFIAVGTPSRRGDGDADLSSLFDVVGQLASKIASDQIIVIKSTVPVGTNKKVSQFLNAKRKNKVEVVSNPEFLREGSAIEDFMKPDRVIVGLSSSFAKKIMTEVYKPLYLREFPIIYTDPESAEIIKYASNAFLATKVSFINEVAHLCEMTGANVKEVSKGMGLDGRIGSKFLHAGPGYGGSCFPKDTRAFVATGEKFNAPQTIVEQVVKANTRTKLRMVDKIIEIFEGNLKNKVISILGVTFKPNTDDMREAPSLTIIPSLQKNGAFIRAVDPKGQEEGSKQFKNVDWYESPYDAAKNSELLVILTEWNEFRALDLKRLAKLMKTPRFADLRNVYFEEEVITSGFSEYISVGR